MWRARVLAPALLVLLAGQARIDPRAALNEYDFEAPQRLSLPVSLREISGLAVTPDGRVFAHADEHAVISELDPRTGQVRMQFALGAPAEPGDFEGIAFGRGRFFLVTSTGLVYSAAEGKANSAVTFQRFDTGAGHFCEIEGLAYDARADRLLLPCKQARHKAVQNRMTVLGVPLASMRVAATPVLSVPEKQLPSALGRKSPSLTSIEVHPRTGSLLLLSSGPAAVIEASTDGSLLGVVALKGRTHPQPEGLTLAGSTLLISDEGGTGTGTLAAYAWRKRNP